MFYQKQKEWAVLVLLSAIVAQSVWSAGLTSSVERPDGAAWFKMNDQRVLPNLFYGGYKLRSPHPEQSVFRRQIELATDAGVQVLSSEIDMPWERNGQTDFSVCDRILDTMRQANPDAFLYVRFAVSSPAWWNEQHPEHRAVFDDGELGEGCLASPVWQEEMLENVVRFIAHCEQKYGDRIAVYQIGNLETGEWFYPGAWEGKYRGFDEHSRVAFKKWAVTQYGSFANVKKRWGQSGLTSKKFRVPTEEERSHALDGDFRNPRKECFVIDFKRFENEIVAETIVRIAGVVKQKTNRRKLVSVFYGYLFDMGGLPKGPASSGHYALERVLQSPDVDLLASPISYGDRTHNGISAFMSPVDSMALWDKLWMVEDDSRTWLCPDDSWAAIYGKVDTLQKSQWVHKRNFGHVIPRRLGMWQMDLLDDGWFDSKELWDNIGSLRNVYKRQMSFSKTFAPEVAVIVDSDGPFYLADDNKLTAPLFSAFRSQLYRMGTPCSFYLLSDVLNGKAPLAKVNLFLGAWNLEDDQRRNLIQKLQGKTALWFHGSGYMNGASVSVENMTQLTGFEFEAGEGSGSIQLLAAPGKMFQPLYWETSKELRMTKAVGRDVALNPRWSVKSDPKVQVLAKYPDGKQAAARRSYQGYESIYVGTLGLPADYLRSLCRKAGVHIYVDSDDVVSADDHFLALSATTAGAKTIQLPFAGTLTDLDSGEVFALPSGQSVDLDFIEGETRLFTIKREGAR